APARPRHRRGRRCAAVDGDRRVRRHARGDVHRDDLHPPVLRDPVAHAHPQREGTDRGRGTRVKRGATILALALTGCMVGPNYERPTTPLPATFPGAPALGVDIAAPAISPQWWTSFDDPVLDEYVATALTDNLDVAFAVARIDEAEAQLREAN